MPRVKILFQKPATFTTLVQVRMSDINYGGHVGNDKLLGILHEARLYYLQQWNYTEMNAGGNSLIMADSTIVYKAESFYNDMLNIEMYADEISHSSFQLFYKITTLRHHKTIDIAIAFTTLICFDYTTRKVMLMSDELKQKLIET